MRVSRYAFEEAMKEFVSYTTFHTAAPDDGICQKKCKVEEDVEEGKEVHPAITLREVAAKNLRKQADKMILHGQGILQPVKVGDNVLISIPSVDCG